MKGLEKYPRGERMEGLMIREGRGNGVEMGFGLFFPKRWMETKEMDSTQTKKNSIWTIKEEEETNQCKISKENRQKKKQTDTHTYSNKRATDIFVSFS